MPEDIGQLQALKEIHMPDNALRRLPASFARLDSLQWLDLGYNRFQKIPSELYQLDNLRYLRLWDRGFSSRAKQSLRDSLPGKCPN
ncbi:MAG: hypothetical protein HC880_13325 [Bacteroidia bacterium]|nr:hypothetical protein [Bacteroidia bacterium]